MFFFVVFFFVIQRHFSLCLKITEELINKLNTKIFKTATFIHIYGRTYVSAIIITRINNSIETIVDKNTLLWS